MDKSIYVAMTGAKAAMQSQAIIAHNLANATSTGFRAVRQSLETAPVDGAGLPTRFNAVTLPESWDNSLGEYVQTGEILDIAVLGEGWIAVQDAQGQEAYTRAGDLHIAPTGVLETAEGQVVLGTGGPVTLPPFNELVIKGDGRISIVPQGQTPNTIAEINVIKLVNPPAEDLVRYEDGLFRLRSGDIAAVDPTVRVASGQLEGSNVNTTALLVEMIAAARNYELHVRTMQNAEENDQVATRLMRMNG
jgi:flagellar basal-body rod protein FlgF